MADLPDQHCDISETIVTPVASRMHPHEANKEVRAAEAADFQGPMDVPKTSGQNPGWALGNEANRPEPTEAVNRSNVGRIVRKVGD
jgi:hypothetical protein